MAVIVKIDNEALVTHPPDDILEAAKGQGLDFVLIVGRTTDGTTWVSASISDAERLNMLLDIAKYNLVSRVA